MRLTLFLVASLLASPAFAMGTRPVVPPNPVTTEMQQAEAADYNAITKCVGSRLFDAPVVADLATLQAANNAAGWAANNRDVAEFQKQASIVHSEAARLSPKYCR